MHKSKLVTQVRSPQETKYEFVFDEVCVQNQWGHKRLICFLGQWSRPKTVCCHYLRVGCCGIITSELAAVASFCSWLFCSKKCPRGTEDSIASLCFWYYKGNEETR